MSKTEQESDRQKRLERRCNRTATSVIEKRLTRETEGGVFFKAGSYYFMRAYAWSSNRHK